MIESKDELIGARVVDVLDAEDARTPMNALKLELEDGSTTKLLALRDAEENSWGTFASSFRSVESHFDPVGKTLSDLYLDQEQTEDQPVGWPEDYRMPFLEFESGHVLGVVEDAEGNGPGVLKTEDHRIIDQLEGVEDRVESSPGDSSPSP